MSTGACTRLLCSQHDAESSWGWYQQASQLLGRVPSPSLGTETRSADASKRAACMQSTTLEAPSAHVHTPALPSFLLFTCGALAGHGSGDVTDGDRGRALAPRQLGQARARSRLFDRLLHGSRRVGQSWGETRFQDARVQTIGQCDIHTGLATGQFDSHAPYFTLEPASPGEPSRAGYN